MLIYKIKHLTATVLNFKTVVKLIFISFYLYSYLYASTGKVHKIQGSCFILRNTHFPNSLEAKENSQIGENDTIRTSKDSKILFQTTSNTPVILNSNSFLEIKKIGQEKDKFNFFGHLFFGEVRIFKVNNFIATPVALIENIKRDTIVMHDKTTNVTTVITLSGTAVISRSRGLSKKIRLKPYQIIKIYPFSYDSPSPDDDLKTFILPSSKEDQLDDEFLPDFLDIDRFKPNWLVRFFRWIF